MSDTPRADLDLHWIEAHGLRLNQQYVSYALAQDLERELNEAKELLKAWSDTAMSGEQLLLEKATDKFLEKGSE